MGSHPLHLIWVNNDPGKNTASYLSAILDQGDSVPEIVAVFIIFLKYVLHDQSNLAKNTSVHEAPVYSFPPPLFFPVSWVQVVIFSFFFLFFFILMEVRVH